ncbi:hypothetical protein [Thermomonas fusca]|uniref:hypothetical protein n=1 Tax=Thermomonas fusca TaxID=215690 RepID=UPI00041DA91C|nr:hypothetical protein [Thermomonas fusca]
MQVELTAKPLQFTEDGPHSITGCTEWIDGLMGFHITCDPSEPPEFRYSAAWGEGDSECFASLEEAKEWCQSLADGWIKECGQATVIAA